MASVTNVRRSSVSSLVGADLGAKEKPKVQSNDEEFQKFLTQEPALAQKVTVYDRWRGSYSPLQKERLEADCSVYYPGVMQGDNFDLEVVEEKGYSGDKIDDRVKSFFPNTIDMKPLQFVKSTTKSEAGSNPPLRVAVVLSGGQAPGGHSIICGIFDRAKAYNPESRVFGFKDGPHGIFSGNFYLLTESIINGFRNTGGFDMLGSGRHKIESEEQFSNSLKVVEMLKLNGVVVIGGDDSNTNAALLGEYFKSKGSQCKVVGAPKTIDGDLKVMPYIPVSFGFDTACRTFSELIGNCCVDALSAQVSAGILNYNEYIHCVFHVSNRLGL